MSNILFSIFSFFSIRQQLWSGSCFSFRCINSIGFHKLVQQSFILPFISTISAAVETISILWSEHNEFDNCQNSFRSTFVACVSWQKSNCIRINSFYFTCNFGGNIIIGLVVQQVLPRSFSCTVLSGRCKFSVYSVESN